MKFKTIAALLFVVSARAASQSPAEKLELVERDFQRATLERGVDGWNSFFADSGAQLQNTSRIVRGHSAIKALMGEFLASKTERLIWWPVATEVSEKGDMAYTFGASGAVAPDSTGKLTIEGRGTYLTVWRLQKDGSWKVTADMGGQTNARALERAADTAAAREITVIEGQRNDAVHKGDRAALERIYSYDFLGMRFGDSPLDRKTLIPQLLKNAGLTFSRPESLVVSVAGETGVVHGVFRSTGDEGSITRASILNIYVRRAGKWVLVRGISNQLK